MKKLLLIAICILSILLLASCGKNGPQDEKGEQGIQGDPGKDGTTPTIEISADGYWVINGVKTEYKATSDGANDENAQGLAFYLKDDGTYAVAVGNAKYLSKIVIPSTYLGRAVTEIASSGFATTKTKEVVIPDSVTSLGDNAFSDCENLTCVTIGNGVTSIGKNAFKQCCALRSVTIGNSVENIGESAFDFCLRLNSINIPDSVISIESRAFAGCISLSNVTIPNSVTSLGDNAFSDCSGLVSITIPANVTTIGDNAFYGCIKLVEIINLSSVNLSVSGAKIHSGESEVVNVNGYLFYTKNDINYLMGYVGDDTNLILPENYNGEHYRLYQGAFIAQTSITSVVLPNCITTIESYAFVGCDNIESITFGNDVGAFMDFAFYACASLKSFTIPDSVTSIGPYALGMCTGLTHITIPNSVISIGDAAFQSCSKITSITFANPNGWTVGSISISATDLSDPATAAEYLTSSYYLYTWRRS